MFIKCKVFFESEFVRKKIKAVAHTKFIKLIYDHCTLICCIFFFTYYLFSPLSFEYTDKFNIELIDLFLHVAA